MLYFIGALSSNISSAPTNETFPCRVSSSVLNLSMENISISISFQLFSCFGFCIECYLYIQCANSIILPVDYFKYNRLLKPALLFDMFDRLNVVLLVSSSTIRVEIRKLPLLRCFLFIASFIAACEFLANSNSCIETLSFAKKVIIFGKFTGKDIL